MKILVVSNLYPSERNPGFGTFVASRVEALTRAGQHVEVVAITDPAVHRRVARKYVSLTVRAIATAVRARLSRRPFDVVEAHIAFPTGLIALLAKYAGGRRVVLFAHGADVRELAWRSKSATRLAQQLFRRADLIVANSAFTKAQVLRLGPLRRSPVVVSPGVVLPPAAAPDERVERDGILFVGRLVPEKGVRELLLAMAGLDPPRPHLTVIGDGPLTQELRRLSAELLVHVTFLGSLPPSEVAKYMNAAEIVAMPSVYEEPLGLVAIEGMAHGAIVVAARTGGLAETAIDGHNAITTAPGNVPGLTTALRRAIALVGTPAGASLRAAALETAQNHDIGRSVSLTLKAYRRLEGPEPT